MGNCSDFLCDGQSVFGRRENGRAMLGGEVVDYTRMYETPLRMGLSTRPRGGSAGGVYESVAVEDDEGDVV